MHRLLIPTIAVAGLSLAACAQSGGGASGAGASLPPAPAYTALTKEQALAQGGRVLTAEEQRARLAKPTVCTGQNRNGALRMSFTPDGKADGGTFQQSWRISEAGEYCYEQANGLRSCQATVVLDGQMLSFDEQGRHRATITSCS